MKYILKNGKEISIRRPVDGNEEIFSLIKILSDESDNFPFTSEDFGDSPWTLLFHWRNHGLRICLGEG